MKWAVAVLVGLGLLAALSALLLVRALRNEAGMGGRGRANAVVATRPLPAMSRITLDNVEVKKVPRKGLAFDYFSDPAQVVGKILKVTVVQDQPLSKSLLVAEGGGAEIAAGLRPGMRAMSVPVSKHSVMGGLLYPGCIVDVIATFRLRLQEAKGQAISTTLLHNIKVLAVQEESIVSKDDKGKAEAARSGARSDNVLTVTLEVDGRQAEALQLAMDNGKITLAMRNPTDQRTAESEPLVLSQGRLAKLGELLAPSVFASSGGEGYIDANGMYIEDPNRAMEMAGATQSAEQLRRLFGDEFGGRTSPQWQMTVIRGRDVQDEVVELSGSGN